MNKISFETKLTVPFCDLDPLNIVWHGNYLKYLELARGEFFDYLGYGYLAMHEDEVAFPIAKMDLKFIEPATLHQKIVVKCTLEEIEPALIIKYEIKDEQSDRKLFKASSMQMCVDLRTKTTIYKAPDTLLKAIGKFDV